MQGEPLTMERIESALREVRRAVGPDDGRIVMPIPTWPRGGYELFTGGTCRPDEEIVSVGPRGGDPVPIVVVGPGRSLEPRIVANPRRKG